MFSFFDKKTPRQRLVALLEGLDSNEAIIINLASRLDIKRLPNDAEAKQQVIDYLLQLPVQLPGKEVQSFGSLINIDSSPNVRSIPYVISDKKTLGFLINFYNQFMNEFSHVAWFFDYPKNGSMQI